MRVIEFLGRVVVLAPGLVGCAVPFEVRGRALNVWHPNQGMEGAEVMMPALRAAATTDETGQFRLVGRARPGCYWLMAHRLGGGVTWYRVRLGADRPNRVRLTGLPVSDSCVPEGCDIDRGGCRGAGAKPTAMDYVIGTGRLEVEVRLPGGAPAAGRRIRLKPPCGDGLDELIDEAGRFVFVAEPHAWSEDQLVGRGRARCPVELPEVYREDTVAVRIGRDSLRPPVTRVQLPFVRPPDPPDPPFASRPLSNRDDG